MERKYTYTTRNSERTSSKKNNEVPTKKSLSHTKPPILEEITGQKLSTGVHPWLEKWLKGEEYYEMISDYRFYSEVFGFRIYDKMPDSIYLTPQNGMIFYLRGYKLEDVNFPRQQELKKIYKWKKMNFITHLPKNNPKVSRYFFKQINLTADNEQISFRMHFVVPYDNCNDLMLCHILQIYPRPNSIISSPQVSEQNVNNPEEMSWVFPENARIAAEENPEKPIEIKLEDFTVKQEYNESLSYQDQNPIDLDYIPPFEDKPYANTRSNSRNRSKSKKSLQQNPVSAVPKYHDQDDLVDYSQNYDKTKGDYYNPNKNPMRAFMCAKLLFP